MKIRVNFEFETDIADILKGIGAQTYDNGIFLENKKIYIQDVIEVVSHWVGEQASYGANLSCIEEELFSEEVLATIKEDILFPNKEEKDPLVADKEIYSPQKYMEVMTGQCISFACLDTVEEIIEYLSDYGYDYGTIRNFELGDINGVIKNGKPVVLVDCSGFGGDREEWQTEYRWFEIEQPEESKNDICE